MFLNRQEWLEKPLLSHTLVAFDIEASGPYPIGDDLVEFGAVKWKEGQIVDEIQFLLKPRKLMPDSIVKIHGITNEMVEKAPLISEKIDVVHKFLSGAVVMAHHAPFDLGFLAVEFEKHNLAFPASSALCTSLLSRKLVHGVENHKLQTLVKHFNFDQGSAHRALDDAKNCLRLGLECIRKMTPDTQLSKALLIQEKNLDWSRYAIYKTSDPKIQNIIGAIENKKTIQMIYNKGSFSGKLRSVSPIGIVMNPDGNYLMALCHIDNQNKRFYLEQIKEAYCSSS